MLYYRRRPFRDNKTSQTPHGIGDRTMALNTANRAGRYVRNTAGYRAFILENLPPSPAIQIDQGIPGTPYLICTHSTF